MNEDLKKEVSALIETYWAENVLLAMYEYFNDLYEVEMAKKDNFDQKRAQFMRLVASKLYNASTEVQDLSDAYYPLSGVSEQK